MERSDEVFGFVNCAAFNRDPAGDRSYYATREQRDAELADLRRWAIGRGLSESAAQTGIYPVKSTAGAVLDSGETITDGESEITDDDLDS